MSLKLLKLIRSKGLKQKTVPADSTAAPGKQKRTSSVSLPFLNALKFDSRTWRTMASIIFFLSGVSAVSWAGFNLLAHTQVPECAYLVDEEWQLRQSAQFNQIEQNVQNQINTNNESADQDNLAVVEKERVKGFDFSNGLQPLSQSLGQITVQILGAVEEPGLYQLNFSQRFGDLIRLAGGLTQDADSQYIIRNFNLAQRLQDEQKIYIPFKQEQELRVLLAEYCQLKQSVVASNTQESADSDSEHQPFNFYQEDHDDSVASEETSDNNSVVETVTSQDDQLDKQDQDYLLLQQQELVETDESSDAADVQEDCISLNQASSAQLQTLSGVGPATAEKIIDNRPYLNINELLEVSGIGQVTLEKLEPDICL